MSFPAYDEYKDSGVNWLGEVPEHWEVKRYKYVIRILQGMAFKSADYVDESNVVSLRMGNIKKGGTIDLLHNVKYLPDEYADHYVDYQLKDGDLLIAMTDMSPTLDFLAVPAFMKNSENGVVYLLNQRVGKVTVDERLESGYLKYLLLSQSLREQLKSTGLGTVQANMSNDDLYNTFLAAPICIDEQKAISSFLDVETSKIDGLVSEQRRLIELLKEKRQAVISHAVTKGLNPNAPMKPSGIQWLGDVPQHWEVLPLKRLGSIRYGIGEPPKYHDDGTPLIRATNVRSGVLTPVGLVFVNPDEIPEQRIVWLEAGDIVVVRSGAGTGDSAIIPKDYGPAIAGFDMVLHLKNANAWFIQFVLLSSYVKEGQIDVEKMRAAQPHLNAEELGNCDVVLPPEDEQTAIVEYLSNQTQRFDMLQAEAERAIELLQERRTALISAAVTGKIDVRGYAKKGTA